MTVQHSQLGTSRLQRARALQALIQAGQVGLAGNQRLRIYGLLSCRSGKRMLVQNRVFFKDEAEALAAGYRPCGHCMPNAYLHWKASLTRSTS